MFLEMNERATYPMLPSHYTIHALTCGFQIVMYTHTLNSSSPSHLRDHRKSAIIILSPATTQEPLFQSSSKKTIDPQTTTTNEGIVIFTYT